MVNYDKLTNDYKTLHYTTLNQRYEYEQFYKPSKWEIKKIRLLFPYHRKYRS